MTVHLINNAAVSAAAARAGQALAPAAAGRALKDPAAAKRARDYRARKRAAVIDDGVPTITPEPVTERDASRVTDRDGVTENVTPAVTATVTQDAKLMGVLALIEGLRAGQAELDLATYEARQAAAGAKAERRQETRTKAIAFVIYYAMAAVLGYAAWAGING